MTAKPTITVKICGINSEAAMDAAVEAAADYVGFVFAESPRRITPRQAAALAARAPGGPKRVGLFVLRDVAGLDGIAPVLAALKLDAVQLYGPGLLVGAARARFPGLAIWRSCPVMEREDLPLHAGGADLLLMEPKARPEDPRPGGLGRALEFHMLAGWQPAFPWMLAGGLTPENVAGAIRASGANAVDVSSGVEDMPGMKNAAKIAAFVRAARGEDGAPD